MNNKGLTMGGSYRTEVTFDELYQNFTIEYRVTENGRFRVDIFKRNGNVSVGSVELCLGRWKIVGDFSEEIRDLDEAIRKAVTIYVRCENEFNDVLTKFNKTQR